MKEKIYTIPVIDSFKESGECPFCNMYNTLEENTIQFVLGPSYMETDVREQTNKLGFCNHHLQKMYSNKNRLGLALMLNSHLDKLQKDIDKQITTDNPKSIKKLFSKKDTSDRELYTYITEKNNDCYICDKIKSTFDKYTDTFFYLWKKDDSFIDLVKSSNGFCLNHFALLYNEAPKYLNDTQLKTFLDLIVSLERESLNRIKEELDWFIKKNDYRFAEEPWKNSKDSLIRTILKINSLRID
ncbi:hypothetical protein SH1V18_46130 [Vallitalea longa]|uniref:ABC transporter substrate-binding protein n=1 Tax=Vallitalea longa TaxID=2936439 RepID=A0A9W6DI49_9FIRM|nr:DUF6062 family protein [Vallitalea longa]GKX32133.1 hypothetical protein SH1V18_46130 [Vallitalea longa]